MAVTDWKLPNTAASVSRGQILWIDPNNAKTSDNTYAYSWLDWFQQSDWLRLTNFGFSTVDIPEGATIDGVEAKIERKADSANAIKDYYLYLRKTTGQTGNNKASADYWPTSDTEKTYGGSSDKWGATLDGSDIRNSDFGIDLAISNYLEGEAVGDVDVISIRIYYTALAVSVASYGFIIG